MDSWTQEEFKYETMTLTPTVVTLKRQYTQKKSRVKKDKTEQEQMAEQTNYIFWFSILILRNKYVSR